MIDMKQLLADRAAGTQAPMVADGRKVYVFYQKPIGNGDLKYAIAMCETDVAARRFARVPDLENALIDARAALEAVQSYAHHLRTDDERALQEICKKGLGE